MGMLLKFLDNQSPYLPNGNNTLFLEVLINLSKSAQNKALSLNREKKQVESPNSSEGQTPTRPLVLRETSLSNHPGPYSCLSLESLKTWGSQGLPWGLKV